VILPRVFYSNLIRTQYIAFARVLWGDNKGQLEGKIEFTQKNGDITLKIDDEQMAGILRMCAPAIVASAQEVAAKIEQEAIEVVQRLIEVKAQPEAVPEEVEL
jgi:hypothetical protein